MYETIEVAREQAARGAQLHRADVSIVAVAGGFLLTTTPETGADVVEVVPFAAPAAP